MALDEAAYRRARHRRPPPARARPRAGRSRAGRIARGPCAGGVERGAVARGRQGPVAYPGFVEAVAERGARRVLLGFPGARFRLAPGRTTAVFVFGNPIPPPPPPAVPV